VQCGTPREIFSNPASDYVADFVANMNPLGVLSARDVMAPPGGAKPKVTVDPDETVRAVMQRLGGPVATVGVVENGALIGQITAEAIVAKLLDPTG